MMDPKNIPGANADDNNDAATPAAAATEKSTLDVMNEALDAMPPEGGTPPAEPPKAEGDDEHKDPVDPAADPVAKKDEGDAGTPAADSKAPAAAAPAKPAAEEDPYKMPEGLGKKAQDRFQGLVEQAKAKDTELTTVREELKAKDEALSWIRENVMTDEDAAEDLVMFADYRNALRAKNFDLAQEIISAQVRQFTLASGRSLEADPLAAFPDLAKKVADLQLDRDSAIELARARHTSTQQQTRQQHQQEASSQMKARQAEVQGAATAVDEMSKKWAENDPDFPTKEAIIQKRLPEIMKTVPIAQVPAHVRMLYESLGEAAPAPRPNPTPTPLRASGGHGGKPAPASALDAMNEGLGYA